MQILILPASHGIFALTYKTVPESLFEVDLRDSFRNLQRFKSLTSLTETSTNRKTLQDHQNQ